MVFDRLRGGRTRGAPDRRPPHLSFGSWADLPDESVVQICHPDWRGVRTVAYAFRSPVVECDDLDSWGEEIGVQLTGRHAACVVIQGWPPGAGSIARLLSGAGVPVKCVLHSSPAQHGAEPGERAVVDEVLTLAREGVLAGVGMAKSGVAEAFASLGFPVLYVPNRAPVLPEMTKPDLGPDFHVGVFAEPFWRKNVTTQLLAVALMDGATAHVMSRPDNRYLGGLEVVEHGELAYPDFIALQGSVDINLYVTLSECHPSTPQESYLAGVPCLASRTSSVFRSDPSLWEMTTVDQLDNPAAIAEAALALYRDRDEAVTRAAEWIESADRVGAAAWAEFVG